MSRPLEGIRVLDAATVLAAPLSASLLGELGAEVIKVEMPGTGDPARAFAPYADGESLHWEVTGRNRKSVTLDLHKPEGTKLFHRLAKECDIVVVNFRPSKLREWNIDFDDLRKTKPNIVMLHLSAFGRSGPYSERPGFARVAEGLAGLHHVTGYPDRAPVFAGYPIADGIAGYYGAFSILAALRNRDITGEGQIVDLALYEPVLRLMEDIAVGYSVNGSVKQRHGNDQANICPNNVYPTADGKHIILPVSTEQMWRRLVSLIGNPDLENFPTNALRLENREVIDGVVSDFTRKHTFDALAEMLETSGLAFGKSCTIDEIFNDPHIRHRGNLVPIHNTRGTRRLTVQAPIPHYSSIETNVTPAPELGQHNREIYSGLLGIDESQLREYTDDGVV